MEEDKNIFKYFLWIVVGILIGVSLCLLINSGILSKISLEIFLPQFLGAFLALLIALFVFGLRQYYLKKKEQTRKEELKNNLLLMIRDEIDFNKEKINHIKQMAQNKGYPHFSPITANKDACWTKIIEYRHRDFNLIKDISALYFKYELLNKTMNSWHHFVVSGSIPRGFFQEVIGICDVILTASDNLLKKLGL